MKSFIFALAAVVLLSTAANAQVSSSTIQVLSSTRDAITIRIAPRYSERAVMTADGRTVTAIGFSGGQYMNSAGRPGLMQIPVAVLLPTKGAAHVELLSQTLDVLPNIDLAPVPNYTRTPDGVTESYAVDDPAYLLERGRAPGFSTQPVEIVRTAYSEQILFAPIQYDAASRTVTRIKEATYRISYPTWSSEGSAQLPLAERDMFKAAFINGDRFEFYRSASVAITSKIRSVAPSFKPSASGDNGIWIQVETGAEGMYRISASDLAAAGASGALDPSSTELLGVGGWMLDENATDTAGEWIEHPYEIRPNGDLVFYASGATHWRYGGRLDNVDGLFHQLNPYTSTGHFLLHLGGAMVGTPLHVQGQVTLDTLTANPVITDRVFTSVVHEQESNFEYPNCGRELLGEAIPHSDAGTPLTVTVDAPGYTGDSTTVRVGYDALVPGGSAGYVTVRSGSTVLGTINARTGSDLQRNWDNALAVPSSASSPTSITLDFTCDNTTSRAVLDWIEFMYRRSTNVGKTSIPFMLIDEQGAYQYTFTDAAGGEVWDVTTPGSPLILGTSQEGNITVQVQAVNGILRRFYAFSDASLVSPKLSKVSTPQLRSTLGQQGTQSIIIAPAAFRAAADSLADIRRAGGQATEPLTVSVVTLEQIYQEFGYGSHDITAIRDFLAYTYRHTVANGTTVPLYVTLLGSGHSDYQNHSTDVPNWVPVWESQDPSPENVTNYRYNITEPTPDDAFFARLLPHPSARQLDLAIGRVSARTLDEALGYAGKVEEYEHHSAQGDWRSVVALVADDRIADHADERDQLDHFGDTEEEVGRLQSRLITNKIYGASYNTVYTSGGRRKPTMETAVIDAMNSGSVVLSYVGHGNPHVWTHESILNVPGTINKFTNFDKLAYVTAATCDFSQFDNYEDESGGVMMLVKPDGGAIGLLGTSRSVTGQENLVYTFYSTLFNVDPASGFGTSSVGSAYIAGKLVCYSQNLAYYYLLGDPSQRLLVPRAYVSFDSINGQTNGGQTLAALSPVRISGEIVRDTGAQASRLDDFNGTVTLTLYDSPNHVTATTTLPNEVIVDKYETEGPILYRGTATVENGRFSASFIVPKDIKFDTASAKITGLAYADDGRSALGATHGVHLNAPDSLLSIIDTAGPQLKPFIGTRAFQSGDDVATSSKLIVDVRDKHGLNTSTASIGHGFIAWVDDDMSTAVDLSPGYVANQDDFTAGTSIEAATLPVGHHTLHVRAFDTFDNPGFADVDFVAKKDAPFRLYEVENQPNPIDDHTVFRFTQPTVGGAAINATLRLYTTDGRLMRTLHASTTESVVEMPWDGRDQAGNRVANGAYAFHVDVENPATGSTTGADGMCIVSH